MEQKPKSQVFPPNFPSSLAAKAFVNAREPAWRPLQGIEAVEWLGAHGYAVLGTEVWRPERDGIQSLPHFQSVDRRTDETWNSFVSRSAAETVDYLKTVSEELARYGEAYVNLTWASEGEFQDLKAT